MTLNEILHVIGASCATSGGIYLRQAVQIILDAPENSLVKNFVRTIYQTIAKTYDTRWDNVERQIRHCIGVIYDNFDMDILTSDLAEIPPELKTALLGGNFLKHRRKTNAEFIYSIANYIKESENEND